MTEQYTIKDVMEGLCTLDQVGSPKPVAEDSSSSTTEDFDMVALLKAAHNHVGGERAFIEQAKRNPAALFNAMLKMGVAMAAKEAPPKLPDLQTLSPSDLEQYSSADLKKMFLASIGVETKSQADALLNTLE